MCFYHSGILLSYTPTVFIYEFSQSVTIPVSCGKKKARDPSGKVKNSVVTALLTELSQHLRPLLAPRLKLDDSLEEGPQIFCNNSRQSETNVFPPTNLSQCGVFRKIFCFKHTAKKDACLSQIQ